MLVQIWLFYLVLSYEKGVFKVVLQSIYLILNFYIDSIDN